MLNKIFIYSNNCINLLLFVMYAILGSLANADELDNLKKPNLQIIESNFSDLIGDNYSLEYFLTEASENVGDSVDPVWKMRFRATVRISNNLYKEIVRDNDIVIVDSTLSKDDTTEIYGRIRSEIFKGKWKSQIVFDVDPSEEFGYDLSYFGSSSIVSGSDEEAEYYESLDKEKRELEKRLEEIKLETEKLANEEVQRKEAANLFAEHIPKIRDKVTNAWIRPGSVYSGARAKVLVKVGPNGEVLDANIQSNSGGVIFGRSILNAIEVASPLPIPVNSELFKYYSSFILNFDPPG